LIEMLTEKVRKLRRTYADGSKRFRVFLL